MAPVTVGITVIDERQLSHLISPCPVIRHTTVQVTMMMMPTGLMTGESLYVVLHMMHKMHTGQNVIISQ